MQCDEVRATRMVAMLLSLGIQSANAMSKEEACREYAKLQRRVNSSGVYMTPAQLADRAMKRRRRAQRKGRHG